MPKEYAGSFPAEGSHLARYACGLSAVEINTTFYRPHQPSTYARWAESVPDDFRFAVKLPREITHERRLLGTEEVLDRFLGEVQALGGKLGPLLVQLPPSLAFGEGVAGAFFAALRGRFTGDIVCEPRHETWFAPQANALLAEARVARAAADPAVVPVAAEPGGWDGLFYYRLHGSPQVYYSAYPDEHLAALAETLARHSGAAPTWCIFDNTALGAATENALGLCRCMRGAARLVLERG